MWDLTDDVAAQAASAVSQADAILISAGAGMGVDSGLPDFRGNEGFWNAYPPFRKLGVSFVDMANPDWFSRDPELAWGFYGHRLGLYRATEPHSGFQILRRWAERARHGSFVFTSNVDGQFQRAGFGDDRIYECHGSLHHLQCTGPCSHEIWPAAEVELQVDEESFRASEPMPACPACGRLARPNVLMFGDWHWIPYRSHAQEQRFGRWLESVAGSRVVVVEMGAGSAVPTVRMTSEQVASRQGAMLIRINPREPHAPGGHVGISAGAQEALAAIDAKIAALSKS
jgi:NAD-dependent SIR2 family protein deacetylase